MDKARTILENIYKNIHRFDDKRTNKLPTIDTRSDLSIMRRLKEDYPKKQNVSTLDQKEEEDKFSNYFSEFNIMTEFESLEIYENGIFWGGTIDNVLQWVFTVPSQKNEPIITYLDGYKPSDQETSDKYSKIEDMIKTYYNEFFEYWKENELDN